MNQDNNKGPGSDMKFVWWDDIGDSQEHVDQQVNPTPCSNHARELDWEEEEEKLNERMRIIGQNGNTGEHYPEYQDYSDEGDDE
jgi:hypothetical protein